VPSALLRGGGPSTIDALGEGYSLIGSVAIGPRCPAPRSLRPWPERARKKRGGGARGRFSFFISEASSVYSTVCATQLS